MLKELQKKNLKISKNNSKTIPKIPKKSLNFPQKNPKNSKKKIPKNCL